ncbi:MAG: ABC-F family ATP-binding cassette domain-containing protein [Oscillospiraceae bacterium]|nr:ABC-F family ATP-binding cassette domain-containing protein [Oscillospiraceae bacterium]
MILSAENIYKSFGVKSVLEDVSLTIEEGDRIGLIGVNGCGKSTFLNILTGDERPDRGTVALTNGKTVGFLRQSGGLELDRTIIEEMESVFASAREVERKMRETEIKISAMAHSGELFEKLSKEYEQLQDKFASMDGYMIDVKIQTVLNGMGFGSFPKETPISTLSGGERTRVALSKLLLEQPDLLILDEPTNHLDFKTLFYLEEFLLGYKGAFLVVSHDRYFLDRVVTSVCEIEWHKLCRYKGNYSKYVVLKEEKLARQQKEYKAQMEKIAELEDYVARNLVRASTSNMAKSRRAALERMEPIEKPLPPPKPPHFNFEYEREPVKDVLHAENISLVAGEGATAVELMKSLSIDMLRGDKIAIIGANGVGKSTLLRELREPKRENAGKIKWGRNVKIGFYDQHITGLDPENTVLNEVWNRYPRLKELDIRSVLGLVRITGDNVFKKVGVLSGGEKAKLALAILMMEHPNVLIFDEPTNHLDISAKEAIDAALCRFTGTVLMVSHDRYLLNRVPNRIIEMTGKELEITEGGYNAYVDSHMKQEKMSPVNVQTKERFEIDRGEKEETKPKSLADFDTGHRSRKQRAEQQKLKNELKAVEQEIEYIENTISDLEEQLAQPTDDYKETIRLCDELEKFRQQLGELYDRWLELNGED